MADEIDPSKTSTDKSSTGADPNKGKEGDGTGAGDGKGADDTSTKTVPYDRFQSQQTKLRDTETELEKYRTAEAKRTEDDALARGEHQKVIDDLRPKAERAVALEASLKAVVDAELKNIPDDKKSLVPDLPPEKQLEWITANRKFLTDGKVKDVNRHTDTGDGTVQGDDKQIFTLAQIKDPTRNADGKTFYELHRADILKAQREGRVRD